MLSHNPHAVCRGRWTEATRDVMIIICINQTGRKLIYHAKQPAVHACAEKELNGRTKLILHV